MDYQIVDKDILDSCFCEMDGLERVYSISFDKEPPSVSFSSPVFFKVGDYVLDCKTWIYLLINFVRYLKEKVNLFKFKPNSFSKPIFTAVSRDKRSEVLVDKGLYMCVNFSSQDCFELIKELLIYAKIPFDQCLLKIRRLPKSEPKIIRASVVKRMKELFAITLESKGYSGEEIEKHYRYMKTMNSLYVRVFLKSAIDNIYLISNKEDLYTWIETFEKTCRIKKIVKYNDLAEMKIYLNNYYEFFCNLISFGKTYENMINRLA